MKQEQNMNEGSFHISTWEKLQVNRREKSTKVLRSIQNLKVSLQVGTQSLQGEED